MITDAIFGALGAVCTFMVGLLPSFDPPAFLTEIPGWLGSLAAGAGGLSPWFPFHRLDNALGLVFGALAVAFGIKVARIVASFFTAGGGSAA